MFGWLIDCYYEGLKISINNTYKKPTVIKFYAFHTDLLRTTSLPNRYLIGDDFMSKVFMCFSIAHKLITVLTISIRGIIDLNYFVM